MLKKIIFGWFVVGLLMAALPALAQSKPDCPPGPLQAACNNLNTAATPTQLSNDLPGTVGLVIKTILSLVGTIFLALTVYAGILWMTAAGREDQIEKAKEILKATVIGLVITLAAYAITAFVTTKLGGQ